MKVNEHLETTFDGRNRELYGRELFRIGNYRFGWFQSVLHDKDGPNSSAPHFWRKVGAIS